MSLDSSLDYAYRHFGTCCCHLECFLFWLLSQGGWSSVAVCAFCSFLVRLLPHGPAGMLLRPPGCLRQQAGTPRAPLQEYFLGVPAALRTHVRCSQGLRPDDISAICCIMIHTLEATSLGTLLCLAHTTGSSSLDGSLPFIPNSPSFIKSYFFCPKLIFILASSLVRAWTPVPSPTWITG